MTREQFERNLLTAKIELLEKAYFDLISETIRYDGNDRATFVLINGARLDGYRKEEREEVLEYLYTDTICEEERARRVNSLIKALP